MLVRVQFAECKPFSVTWPDLVFGYRPNCSDIFIIMQGLLLVLFCWTIDWHFPKRGLPIGSGKSKRDKLRGRKERGFWGPVLFNILPYLVQPGGLSSPISLKQARTLCSDLFWGVKSSPLHSTTRHHNLSISDHTLWGHILGPLTFDFVFLPARIGSTSWQKKFAGPSNFFFHPVQKHLFQLRFLESTTTSELLYTKR